MRGLVMSLVCIFHDRAQIVHAKTLEYILIQSGLDPWLADSASMGNWRHDVERALGRADCLGAIVIWSESSLSNNIVVEEAELCVKSLNSKSGSRYQALARRFDMSLMLAM
jgi:hypothetical protein